MKIINDKNIKRWGKRDHPRDYLSLFLNHAANSSPHEFSLKVSTKNNFEILHRFNPIALHKTLELLHIFNPKTFHQAFYMFGLHHLNLLQTHKRTSLYKIQIQHKHGTPQLLDEAFHSLNTKTPYSE